MRDYDDYRRQAAFAQKQADRAKSPADKESWLRLVQGWLSLLPKRSQTKAEDFDERVRAEGTHQNISGEEQ